MIFALGPPSPNTVCVPRFQRSHALQFWAALCSSASVPCGGIRGLVEPGGLRFAMLVLDAHPISLGQARKSTSRRKKTPGLDNRGFFLQNFCVGEEKAKIGLLRFS